jgi:hypothetical protein
MPRLAMIVFLPLLAAAAPALPGFDAAVAPPPAATAPAATAPAATAPTLAAPETAADFLTLAAQQVAQRQARPALRALGRAETRLLSRSVPLFQTRQLDTATPVRLIEQARGALRAGDFAAAGSLIARAMPLVAPPTPKPH